jgi:uracil-DNA glycosylase
MDEFIKQVKKFIDRLKEQNLNELVFNPWKNSTGDDRENAANIRCANLERYLIDHKGAKYIVIAESPSYGAKYTGIAMTSEEVTKKNPEIFNGIQTTSIEGNTHENTATMVWECIKKHHKDFVLWNAFAFNSHDEKGSPRTPSKKEIVEQKAILEMFLEMFKNKEIISLGKTSEKLLNDLGYSSNYIRHPSCGGKNKFLVGMQKYINS